MILKKKKAQLQNESCSFLMDLQLYYFDVEISSLLKYYLPMKIEKINDNQIKCTLTRSDLASHQLKISELVYDNERSKEFFQDMIEQAEAEVGFETDDDSLVVEAIPVSMDCIVLMVTKVEDPEEYVKGRNPNFNGVISGINSGAGRFSLGDILDTDKLAKAAAAAAPEDTKETSLMERMFSFDDLETVIKFAHQAHFTGESSLYKSPANGRYYLILRNTGDIKEFGSVCNSAFEYGSKEPFGFARSAYVNEHFELIIADKALQSLAYV